MPKKESNTSDDSWDPIDVFVNLRSSPLPTLSETSRKFLQENALDWSSSRNRQLKAAIKSGDREQFTFVLEEYAAVVGKENAILAVLFIWGNMVAEET